jgi:hypothetical protein
MATGPQRCSRSVQDAPIAVVMGILAAISDRIRAAPHARHLGRFHPHRQLLGQSPPRSEAASTNDLSSGS